MAKIAARFPIKPNLWIVMMNFLIHGFLAAVCINLLIVNWWQWLTLITLCFSFFYTYQQTNRLFSAPDDLCWTGENWLMYRTNANHDAMYLNLLDNSWLTSSFCLLKFSAEEKQFAWFFSRLSIGDRAYRELCRIVKSDMREGQPKSYH